MNTFRKLNFIAIILAVGVILMGAFTRINFAGLACPDWPLCFGEFWISPEDEAAAKANTAAATSGAESSAEKPSDSQTEYSWYKAALEMIHRYMASVLGLLIFIMMVLAIRHRRRVGHGPLALPIFLFILVCFQGALGMWTVTKLVSPPIVTAHLLGGMSTFALLVWQYYRLRAPKHDQPDAVVTRTPTLAAYGAIALIVLSIQITLGGWTSTNFALNSCNWEFPTCSGSLWPEDMNFDEGFKILKPLGINYELRENWPSEQAREAIQVVHRVGAVVTLVVFIAFALALRRAGAAGAGAMLLGTLVIQIALGILTAIGMFETPLLIATAHNGGAVLLLFALLYALARIMPPAPYQY